MTRFHIECGPMRAEFLETGATLARFQRYGRDLVLGFHKARHFSEIPVYAGATVGPVANRISGGTLQLGARTINMECNENGETCLHSGHDGTHARDWTGSNIDETTAIFRLSLPDGTNGLPGNREIELRCHITPDCLELRIDATTDASTFINIAHHPYWALDTTVKTSKLWTAATHYLAKTPKNTPDGRQIETRNSVFDFSTPRPLNLDTQYDHCLCFEPNPKKSLRHVASLEAADGLTLHIDTTEPALQVYDGHGLPNAPDFETYPHALKPYAGLALEPQGYPDAPNHPEFPSILCTPARPYQQITRYRFEQRPSPATVSP